MREAGADVVDVMIDHATSLTILVLTEEAEHRPLSVMIEATILLLWTNVQLDVLLVVDGDDHSTIERGQVGLLLTVQLMSLLLNLPRNSAPLMRFTSSHFHNVNALTGAAE